MRKVAGSNPIAVAEVFADYSVSVSEVGGSIPGHCKKKISNFFFFAYVHAWPETPYLNYSLN